MYHRVDKSWPRRRAPFALLDEALSRASMQYWSSFAAHDVPASAEARVPWPTYCHDSAPNTTVQPPLAEAYLRFGPGSARPLPPVHRRHKTCHCRTPAPFSRLEV